MMGATAMPPVLPTAALAAGAAAPSDAAVGPDFAGLLAALELDAGDSGPVDELPPEAMALLLAAMGGAQAAVPRVAAGNEPLQGAKAAGGIGRDGGRASPVPTALKTPGAGDSALALESVLRDLLIPETAETPDVLRAEAAAARGEAPDIMDVPSWTTAPLDLPQSRAQAPESPLRYAPPVHTPVGAQGWSDELAGRIAWIAREDLQSASIRLAPEHLGPLDVQISVRDGDAVVAFGASHAETRAALEQALPRLRELLASQGISLAQASVSEHAARQDRPMPQRPTGSSAEEPEVTLEGHLPRPAGLVDLYA
jgi:flagellar hook-length control protein FliK